MREGALTTVGVAVDLGYLPGHESNAVVWNCVVGCEERPFALEGATDRRLMLFL